MPSTEQSRVVVRSISPVDPRGRRLAAAARDSGLAVDRIDVLDIVHLDGDLDDAAISTVVSSLIVDPVHEVVASGVEVDGDVLVIETGPRPGVTDVAARELRDAAHRIGITGVERVSTGHRFVVHGFDPGGDVAALATRVLANEVVERWAPGELPPAFVDEPPTDPGIAIVPIRGLTDDDLARLNRDRGLSLDPAEMAAIRAAYDELDRDPTDAELEMLAQTWSEHCCHKTFRASITMDDGSTIEGLLPLLRQANALIDAPWVVSALEGDAGVVVLDDTTEVAIKVETHNHPSAIEPFGGAATGVGGVVRDVIATSAVPIALTDVLCFGPTDADRADLPDGVLHPKRVRDGVVHGIGDYGNKIGVPTVAGAILHHPGYTTTPLVFAGCVGVRPRGVGPSGPPRPGDLVVVIGGAVGRDGVGGATFSSRALEAETAEEAGSSVQIGAPIVEKGLIDVVHIARDRGWYSALTDCGAGGLSSAVGELAEEVGVEVDLDRVPRKYAGLAPWEVWLSEAQERIVLAVPPDHVDDLRAVAADHELGCDVIGTFSGDGRIRVTCSAGTVIDLPASFIHDGRPRRHLDAVRPDTSRPPRVPVSDADLHGLLLDLLAHESLCSREDVIRTYDHEILGSTVIRPLTGVHADAPSDGVVVAIGDPTAADIPAVAIGIGVSAVLGRHDPALMAEAVIDEAVRNAVAAGADPDRIAVLDNFSWGNPKDPAELGLLVATVEACAEVSVAYGTPWISGKDSLNNVHLDRNGDPDPVPPTLVITAMGMLDSADQAVPTDPSMAGCLLYLVGTAQPELGGSHLDLVLGDDLGGALPTPDRSAPDRYRRYHAAVRSGLVDACHDVSEGGIAACLAEMAIGADLGLDADLTDEGGLLATLFGESCGRLVVSVRPDRAEAFEDALPDARPLGRVTVDPRLRIAVDGHVLVDIGVDQLRAAHTGQLVDAEGPS